LEFETNKAALQKWIGYTDVKSRPTYFYVLKTEPFSKLGVPIPFESERLNIGKAMDLQKGKFTAPRNGIYFFAFNGIAITRAAEGYLDVALMVNGGEVGRAQCKSHVGNEWETLALQSTIYLNAGDQVWLQIVDIVSAVLHDQSFHFTHFNGRMLQEYISP
jgi:hypothetical protein